VVEQIRKLAKNPELVKQVFEEASREQKKLIPKLEAEQKRLFKDNQSKSEEIRRSKIPVRGLVDAIGTNGRSAAIGARLAELEGIVARIERRVAEIEAELTSLREHSVDPDDIAKKLAEFEGVWEVMWPSERSELIHQVMEAATCDGDGKVKIAFRIYEPRQT